MDDLLALAGARLEETMGESVDLGEASAPPPGAGRSLRRLPTTSWLSGTATGGCIWAAPADVAHILDNLIENAIRYSPPRDDHGRGRPGYARPSLVVFDTGRGIPAEEQKRVFEAAPGRRAGGARAPGTGLGLAIVAELTDRWDGNVEILAGPGTRIRASFPAHEDVSTSPTVSEGSQC